MRLPLISRRNQMNTAQPIRNLEDLKNFKNYYKEIHPNARNQLLVILGLNTALRISDLLTLRWEDVYNFSQNRWQEHIEIIEQKTGKTSCIYINHNIHACLQNYQAQLQKEQKPILPEKYLFPHGAVGDQISYRQPTFLRNLPLLCCGCPLQSLFGQFHRPNQSDRVFKNSFITLFIV